MSLDYIGYSAGEEPIHFAPAGDGGCSSRSLFLQCTGPAGHDGRHYADGVTQCWASWSDPA